jgi:uncharacterized protein (TIGR02284 family)
MEKSEVISTLNELLKTSRDGECGFGDAAKQVKSGNLKATLETAASRCAVAAAELETHVRALGGETSHSGTVTGALHRAWSNIKSSVSTMDDHAVLAECEGAEDSAKGAYEAALKKDLPVEVRALVERQYQGVKENHDRIRDLRDSTRAA